MNMNQDYNIDIRNEVDYIAVTPLVTRKLAASVGLCVICLLLSFALLLFATPRAMAASQTVVLKQNVYLSDNVVTVGDVFENAGTHADHVLAPAPAAGDTMVLGYGDLKRIADAFNYEWTASGADQITLQRAVSEIEKSDIILIGVSRTSKTPTAIYLANKGFKTSNIPLVNENSLPIKLKNNPQLACVVGLNTEPERLVDLRKNRMNTLKETENKPKQFESLAHGCNRADNFSRKGLYLTRSQSL